jgi:uncharacterized lipoprotein YehR (DUF1307 family)
MKKMHFLKTINQKKAKLTLSVLLLLIVSCGPTPEDAKVYKQKINGIHKNVVLVADSLETAFESFDSTQIKYAMHRANVVSRKAISDLKELKPITPDSFLFKATGHYFQTFREVLGNEYREKLDLYCIPDEKFTYDDQQQIERLDIKKREKLRTAAQKLKEAEAKFAEEYNLQIIER